MQPKCPYSCTKLTWWIPGTEGPAQGIGDLNSNKNSVHVSRSSASQAMSNWNISHLKQWNQRHSLGNENLDFMRWTGTGTDLRDGTYYLVGNVSLYRWVGTEYKRWKSCSRVVILCRATFFKQNYSTFWSVEKDTVLVCSGCNNKIPQTE